MQFIDLKSQYQRLEADIQAKTAAVLAHGQYILGPEVHELEEKLASYVGAKHCLSVANGTDALLIALMALGIKAGDEVIVPAFTFIAPAEMVALLGAKPIFIDIGADTYNLDPKLLEAAITPKTKAIIAVNMFGLCAEFEPIEQLAKAHNIPVIEDAAQSIGAKYHGKASGRFGTISCTSFFPSKPLGCYGDGGACFTSDDDIAQRIVQIRNHGQQGRYNHVEIGLNSRLDSIQAAVLLAKLAIFDDELQKRTELAAYFNQQIGDAAVIPATFANQASAYAQYTVRVEHREAVIAFLSERQIPTAVHYPCSLADQPVFKQLGQNPAAFPVSQQATRQVLSLPFSPYIKPDDIDKIAQTLTEAVRQYATVS